MNAVNYINDLLEEGFDLYQIREPMNDSEYLANAGFTKKDADSVLTVLNVVIESYENAKNILKTEINYEV